MAGASPLQIPTDFTDQQVMDGLRQPTGMAFLPDGRLLVVEQSGGVRMIVEGKLGAIDPVLTVDSVLVSPEQGLTGIAVDPRWPSRPYVYVYYDALELRCRITRFKAMGDLTAPTSGVLWLDPASRYEVIRDIPDLRLSHNGGSLRFGPDGMLYAGLGEDTFSCASQDTLSLRGVMIRCDLTRLPDGPGGPPDKTLLVPMDNPMASHPNLNARLVWASGLRNPFRFHVDPRDGSLFVADVGWNLYEEIDHITSPGGDYGWPYLEGPAPYVSSCSGIVKASQFEAPIHYYDRTGFTATVVSGDVYRRGNCFYCSFPNEYVGDYFFSDYYAGFLRRLKHDENGWSLAAPVPGQPDALDWGLGFEQVSDYLVAPDGSLWYCRMARDYQDGTGEIHRIFYSSPLVSVGARPTESVSFAAPYPSPTRGRATLTYTVPRSARVSLSIYDASGRQVRRLGPPTIVAAGRHTQVWDGRTERGEDAAPGMYLARLVVDGVRFERNIPLVR